VAGWRGSCWSRKIFRSSSLEIVEAPAGREIVSAPLGIFHCKCPLPFRSPKSLQYRSWKGNICSKQTTTYTPQSTWHNPASPWALAHLPGGSNVSRGVRLSLIERCVRLSVIVWCLIKIQSMNFNCDVNPARQGHLFGCYNKQTRRSNNRRTSHASLPQRVRRRRNAVTSRV